MGSPSISADQLRKRYSSSSSSFRVSYKSGASSRTGFLSSASSSTPDNLGGYQDAQELATMNKTIETNQATTQIAKEAAKLATQIVEVADDATMEIYRQQQVLDEVERKQEQIREDTKVAEHAAQYVARRGCLFWLFSCCCACDAHSGENIKNRGVQQRQRQLEDEKHAGLRKEDMGRLKAAVGSRKAFHVEALGHLAGTPKKQERQADARASPPSGSENDTEDALSSSDMSHSEPVSPLAEKQVEHHGVPQGNGLGESSAPAIPDFVPEGDQAILRHQFQQQDDALDLISAALDHVQAQSAEWNVILSEQVGRLERIETNADETDMRFKNLNKTMKKA